MKMSLILAAGFAAISLSACATVGPTEPEVKVVEKVVPVVQPCVSAKVPGSPTYPDTDLALAQAPSAAARFGLIAAGRVLRIQRAEIVEPVIAACRLPTPVHDGP